VHAAASATRSAVKAPGSRAPPRRRSSPRWWWPRSCLRASGKTLSTDGSIRALALAAFGGTVAQAGQSVIATFLLDAIERLRRQRRLPGTEAELQQELERQLLAALQANDQPAAQLRADAAAILEQVQGVEAALEAATGDLRQALSEAFAEYGSSFAEFRWMLDETRQTLTAIQQEQARLGAEQRHQTELARETLAKTNLILRRLVVRAAALPPATPAAAAPAEATADEPPAVAGDVSPYRGLAAFQAEDAEWFFGLAGARPGTAVRRSRRIGRAL
jgi:hypothetical protein